MRNGIIPVPFTVESCVQYLQIRQRVEKRQGKSGEIIVIQKPAHDNV